jgi:penicillin-binding protein 1A
VIEIPAGASQAAAERAARLRETALQRDQMAFSIKRSRRRSTHDEPTWRRRARSREARLALAKTPGDVSGEPPRNLRRRLSAAPGRPPRGRGRLRKLRLALVILGFAVLAFVAWIFGIMMAVAQDLPQLEDRAQYERAQNSVVTDRFGEKLATLTNNEGRILIPSDKIAPVMKEATVSIEDQRFYEHRGVDWLGIVRAVKADILSGSSAQGASTITQQFVKNALQAQGSRTVFEKLREAALAYHLERRWSKDKILTEYLNEIYFGEGAYGIEAAAETYFGWNHPGCGSQTTPCAAELLPWEAAMLAGIISSPTGYDPRTNPDAALARRNQVLQNMADQGYITEENYQEYISSSQYDIPKPSQVHPPAESSRAPYFTSWLRQQLVDKYGAGEAFGGGLDITSTLDLALQQRCQEIGASHLAGLGPSTAIVVLDNATGGVRAMVGGFDYNQQPFNLATQGHRQPGSAFKPFTLVTALEQGHSPTQVFPSAPQALPYKAEVQSQNGKKKVVDDLFRVNNYGDSYLGSASISTATTYSDNSVYSQLGMQVGPANIAETARRMGVETDLSTGTTKYSVNGSDFQPYNPALILGGLQTGVTPLEMAHAFETLAEGGRRITGSMAAGKDGPVGIVKVVDSSGDPVPTNDGASGANETETEQVVPESVASTAVSILHTVVSSGTGQRAATGDDEWGKTGTTENNGDAWFVGSTKDITVAVWVGFPNGVQPMETEFAGGPVDGGTIPALIFHDVVLAYDQLQSGRGAGIDPTTGEVTSTTTTTTDATSTTTPTTTTTTETTAPPPDQPATPAPSPGNESSGGGGAAPSGGGPSGGVG